LSKPARQPILSAKLELFIFQNEVRADILIVQDMHTTFYGSREFAIKDCNAYILAFSEQKES
jgi:hypothetical protein